MANRYPIANGNWSDPLIWNGGLGLPTASDAVYANNKIITIDQSIDVLTLAASSTTGISASGYFIASDGISIKANLGGSNSAITTYSVFPLTLTLGVTAVNPTLLLTGSMNVSLTGSINQGASSCITVVHMGTGTLNISGSTIDLASVAGGTYNNSQILIYTGSVNIIGNVTNISTTGGVGIWNWYGRLNVIGNVQARINGPTTTYSVCIQNEYGIVNLTGNITATSITQGSGAAHGIQNNAGLVNITGNLFSSASATPCVTNTTALATTNITGNVTAGTTAAAASNSTVNGILNIIGQIQASTTANAVFSSGTTATNIFSGPLINSGSRNAIYCYNVRLYDDITTRYVIGVSGSNDTITLFSPDQVTGVPSGSNVRAGLLYGPGNELTGSMNVPHPNSVSYGVAVDNTTGSALVNPEDLWNIAIISLTASNSIGQRLSSVATSASVAAITSAF